MYKFDPMDFETIIVSHLCALYECINLILWILKQIKPFCSLLTPTWYKFDPMDFETSSC